MKGFTGSILGQGRRSLPEADLLELAAERNSVHEALAALEGARGQGEVTDDQQQVVAKVLAKAAAPMQAAMQQGWQAEMVEVFTRIEQVALVWEDIGWQARGPGYACILLTQLQRAEDALDAAERSWAVVAKHQSPVLGELLRGLLIASASGWHEKFLDGLQREHVPRAIDLLTRTGTLAEGLGAEKLQAMMLGFRADLCMQTPGRALEAVRLLEHGWQLMALEEMDEAMWNNIKLMAEGSAEHLQSAIEKEVGQGHMAAARELTRLLVRLERSHPDQSRLAEALATLAQLSEDAGPPETVAMEAWHLGEAYALRELVDGMDKILAEVPTGEK